MKTELTVSECRRLYSWIDDVRECLKDADMAIEEGKLHRVRNECTLSISLLQKIVSELPFEQTPSDEE